MAGGFSVEPEADLPTLLSHLDLLGLDRQADGENEVAATPVFTESVRKHAEGLEPKPLTQYGLLAGDVSKMSPAMFRGSLVSAQDDPRLYYNITAPASVFICGSQGSGKSHTLSCLLENCLIPSSANVLPRPLNGIVFHYDTFISDTGGSPCEAAYLSSHKDVKVRVLCPPTNIRHIRRIYSRLPGVRVEELRFDESDLNTSRMLDLMAVSSIQGAIPLYLNVVTRILRELRVTQQATKGSFNYAAFKRALNAEDLTPAQKVPLQQRLDTLESFMVERQVGLPRGKKFPKQTSTRGGNNWTPKPGQLTIVDLSCPCVTREAACSLFSICLSLFLEHTSEIGRVIALDEAHKYMTEASDPLTELLLSTIRLQRHVGARVFISTQEPTISPRLLDLCSVTIVHRFSSPDWLRSLKQHLAGAGALNTGSETAGAADDDDDDDEGPSAGAADVTSEIFSKIMRLSTGEALMFAPSAITAVAERPPRRQADAVCGGGGPDPGVELVPLHHRVMTIRVRKRVTADGGRSVMAT